MLRFAPHELAADPAHRCPAWPVGYADIEPHDREAERLLAVRQFPVESDFSRIAAGLTRRDPGWRAEPLAVGLAEGLPSDPEEAGHFDGFASVHGLKPDARLCFLDRIRGRANGEVLTAKPVTALIPAGGDPRRVAGVVRADGTRYSADRVLPAAGALHSPRLLQRDLEDRGLAARLPEGRDEHRRLVRTLSRQFLGLGYLSAASLVDPWGYVHGLENLYVVDGSVLPRSSRVNPALGIYAWVLPVADRLAAVWTTHQPPAARVDTPLETPVETLA